MLMNFLLIQLFRSTISKLFWQRFFDSITIYWQGNIDINLLFWHSKHVA
jgi:hypothetical protein